MEPKVLHQFKSSGRDERFPAIFRNIPPDSWESFRNIPGNQDGIPRVSPLNDAISQNLGCLQIFLEFRSMLLFLFFLLGLFNFRVSDGRIHFASEQHSES
jgi:hypothetical protein